MYIGATITGVLLMAACAIPIVIAKRSRKRKIQTYLDKLIAVASHSMCRIDEYEVWNDSAIGIDKSNMRLFFIQVVEEKQHQKEIDLKTVYECQVVNKGRTIKNQGESERVIEKLDLGIIFTDTNAPEMLLPFYDSHKNSLTIHNELELVNKWVGLINEHIDDNLSELSNADQSEIKRYF